MNIKQENTEGKTLGMKIQLDTGGTVGNSERSEHQERNGHHHQFSIIKADEADES